MSTQRLTPILSLVTATLLFATSGYAQSTSASSASKGVSIELNRLDGTGEDCRVTIVEKNDMGAAVVSLKLDLVVFNGEGIVAKRVGVDAGPLKAGRTVVKTFDLKGLACENVGRVLINDVLSCDAGGLDAEACLEAVEPHSRVSATFDK